MFQILWKEVRGWGSGIPKSGKELVKFKHFRNLSLSSQCVGSDSAWWETRWKLFYSPSSYS